jgi:hypothetical protein
VTAVRSGRDVGGLIGHRLSMSEIRYIEMHGRYMPLFRIDSD